MPTIKKPQYKALYTRGWPTTMQAALYYNRKRNSDLYNDTHLSTSFMLFWICKNNFMDNVTHLLTQDDTNKITSPKIYPYNPALTTSNELIPSYYINFVSNLPLQTLDNKFTNRLLFEADGVTPRNIWVGEFMTHITNGVQDYENKHLLFATVNESGISNIMAFASPRSTSTNPTLDQVQLFLAGDFNLTATYLADKNGRPLLNKDGTLIIF